MTSTMHIDLRIGQTLFIGDAQVTLLQKSGQLARLHVQAPRSIAVIPPNRKPSAQPDNKGQSHAYVVRRGS